MHVYPTRYPDGGLWRRVWSCDVEAVCKIGEQLCSWYYTEKGLFSDEPHLYLQESFWDTEENVAIQRYYVIDAAAGEVARYSSSTQAYTHEEYRSLLAECGFGKVVLYPSLGGSAGSPEGDLIGVLSQKDNDNMNL